MIIKFSGSDLQGTNDLSIPSSAVVLSTADKKEQVLTEVGVDMAHMPFAEVDRAIYFAAGNNFDYISILVPDFISHLTETALLEAYITKDYLLISSTPQLLEKIEDVLTKDGSLDKQPIYMLSQLFTYLLPQNFTFLDKIEDEIEELEERATLKKPEDHTAKIIALRKELLMLKRYFESLYDVLEDLEENQNELIPESKARLFSSHKKRSDRYLSTVLNLRDYLTQVREAFQNQLDISLNQTMNFFTVIASVFLPLTLLVGWYGMNLQIPETKYAHTYPIIIVVSIVFVVVSLIFYKRKGWF